MSCDDCAQTVANYNAMEQRWREARARERRLVDALNEAVFLLDHLTVEDVAPRSRTAIFMAIDVARVALADQPVADEARV